VHVEMSGRRAVLLVAVLLIAGCSWSEGAVEPEPGVSAPAAGRSVPAVSETVPTPAPAAAGDGTTTGGGSVRDGETDPGTVLEYGEAAIIGMGGRGARGVVAATVEIARGEPADLEELDTGDTMAGAQPYYVSIALENVGDTALPLVPLDNDFHGRLDDGTAAQEPGTVDGFRPCDAEPAPADFDKGKRFETCRVFVAPRGRSVETVVYEGFETPYAADPIIWEP